VNAHNNTKFQHSTLIKYESSLCRTKRDEWMNGREEWEHKAKKIVQSRYEHAIVTNLIIRSQKHKKLLRD
jgi:hypothetical protein